MTRQASIKETGEQISDANWQRFEAAVGIDNDRPASDDVQTDQPFREEAEHPESAKDDKPKSDDAGSAERDRDAGKTTERTE